MHNLQALAACRVLVNFSYSRLFDCYRRLQDAGGLGAAPPAGSRGSAPAGSEGQRPWRGKGAEPLAGSRGSAPEAIRFSQSDKVKSTQPVMHKFMTILMTRSGEKKKKNYFLWTPTATGTV